MTLLKAKPLKCLARHQSIRGCAEGPSTGEIIAKSANQIVTPKFRRRTKTSYYINQTLLSSWNVGRGSGNETKLNLLQWQWLTKEPILEQLAYNNTISSDDHSS